MTLNPVWDFILNEIRQVLFSALHMNIRPFWAVNELTEKIPSSFAATTKVLHGREILDANFIWMNNMKMYKVKSKSSVLRTFNASLILHISFFSSFKQQQREIFFVFFTESTGCKEDFKIKMYVAKYLRIS